MTKTGEDEKYTLVSSQNEISGIYNGEQLLEGIPVKLHAGDTLVVVVQ